MPRRKVIAPHNNWHCIKSIGKPVVMLEDLMPHFDVMRAVAHKARRRCLNCGSHQDVELESPRTFMSFEPIPLCRRCAAQHHKERDAEIQEYQYSVLYS